MIGMLIRTITLSRSLIPTGHYGEDVPIPERPAPDGLESPFYGRPRSACVDSFSHSLAACPRRAGKPVLRASTVYRFGGDSGEPRAWPYRRLTSP